MKIAVLFQYCEFSIVLISSTRNFCSSSGSELPGWPFSAAGAFAGTDLRHVAGVDRFFEPFDVVLMVDPRVSTAWTDGIAHGRPSLTELGEGVRQVAVLL